MIRIARPPIPQIPVFTAATVKNGTGTKITRAESERRKAIEFFTDPRHYANGKKLVKKTFNFAVYKDPALVRALESIFGNKCAYCESHFGHVTPKDVEHFRPKSEIETANGSSLVPGYFWLAGEWTNLLVSCADCNRAREHEVPGQTAKVRRGKHTQFPLTDETKRVRLHDPGTTHHEDPSILDPCKDNPEEYFAFDELGLIHARAGIPADANHKAKVSIDVYALQRKGLVEIRLRVINDVVFQFEQLSIAVIELNTLIEEQASEIRIEAKREQIRKIRQHLAGKTSPGSQYLGMIRDYIRRTKTAGRFDDLIAAGIDPESLLTQ